MPFRNVLPGTKMAYDVSGNIDRVGVRNIARTDCLALLRDFVLCRFEWIRKDLSSAQGSHLYRFRDASCSARPTAASSRPLRLLGRGAESVFNSEASLGIPGEASLLNIIIVIIVRARKRLPEFFLAYCGDEFFEVEWLEVCDVFEFSCAECRDGRGEHR